MKKFFSLVMLFFIVIFAAGCAQTNYEIIFNADGSIVERFSVSIDKKQLEQAGYNYDMVVGEIVELMKSYANDLFLLDVDKNLNSHIVAGQVSVAEANSIYASLKPSISHNAATCVVTYEVKYSNNRVIAFGLNEYGREQPEPEISYKTTWFTLITKQKLTTPYSDLNNGDENNMSLPYWLNNYFNQYVFNSGAQMSISRLKMVYTYATPLARLHSNADVTFNKDGITYHQWVIDSANPERYVYVYKIQARSAAWLITATCVGTALLITLVVVNKTKLKGKLQTDDDIEILKQN